MRIVIAAVSMLMAANAAWGESTQADWEKHAQPIVDVFGQCARAEVDRTWKNTAPAADVAASAVATCEQHLAALPPVLAKPPFSGSEDDIKATLEQIKTEVHDAAAADVEKRRKEAQ